MEAATESVRKVVISGPGAYDKLKFENLPASSCGPDEVAIDVKAIGVNYADVIVRMGLYQSAKEFVGWPITPGFEIAGTVREVGANVTEFEPGARVFGVTLFNGYSTRVVVPKNQVFALPESMTFEQAAGFPATYLTAYFALFELAHPRPGAKILVHSAAGGVGTCLVQLAKAVDCEVAGVVGGTHKVDTVRGFGADLVIDKSKQDLWAEAERFAPDGYDVVCDANGVSTLKESYEHLRRAGKLVIYGFHSMMSKKKGRPNWIKLAADYLRTPRFNPFDLTNESRSVLAFNLSYLYDRADILEEAMTRLLGWLDEGKIQPPPVTTYPFDRVADAHRDIESGKTIGKLVLVP